MDDLFMGWGFLIVWWPVVAILNAVIALPSAICSKIFNKRVGMIIWLLATFVTMGYRCYPYISDWRTGLEHWGGIVEYAFFLVVPQVVAYPLARDKPQRFPLIAAGLGAGAVVIWMLLGALSGATAD